MRRAILSYVAVARGICGGRVGERLKRILSAVVLIFIKLVSIFSPMCWRYIELDNISKCHFLVLYPYTDKPTAVSLP